MSMSQIPRIICLVVLCSFTFTTSASSLLCSLSMQDKVDTQSDACHSDKSQAIDKSLDDCCHDMHSCGGSISFFSDMTLTQIQIVHSLVQVPANEHVVFNSSSPPERPPKLHIKTV